MSTTTNDHIYCCGASLASFYSRQRRRARVLLMLGTVAVLGIAPPTTPRRARVSLSMERGDERSICCAVYTVITRDYDDPADLGECSSPSDPFVVTKGPCLCGFFLYHDDATPAPPEPWRGRRRELPENFTHASGKLQASLWKLRQPDGFDECPRTIFIDSNVRVIRDPYPLLNVCESEVCMFTVGRNLSEEIRWLVDNGHANKTSAERLRTEYQPFLAEPTWYSKVIVRTYGSDDPESSDRVRCFEARWLEALAGSPVERDQAHLTRAAAAAPEPTHPAPPTTSTSTTTSTTTTTPPPLTPAPTSPSRASTRRNHGVVAGTYQLCAGRLRDSSAGLEGNYRQTREPRLGGKNDPGRLR